MSNVTENTALIEFYQERMKIDWDIFFSNSEKSLPNYWEYWEKFSNSWRVPIQFIQPIGLDSPRYFESLEPLLSKLDSSPEVIVPPTDWLHISWIHIGFLMATDIMWSQVETFYVNASPRLRRIPPFSIKLSGVSIDDKGVVYVGVYDSGSYRDARKQARNGVPKVYEVLRDSNEFVDGRDIFIPKLAIGHLSGEGNRQNLLSLLEDWRTVEFTTIDLTHLQMARIPIMPHDHYASLDVVAQIEMRGENYREGYHN
tara:strand:- start:579 stop:1346 length:768 start_codon:yes stop_codon:yes gene_type:complete